MQSRVLFPVPSGIILVVIGTADDEIAVICRVNAFAQAYIHRSVTRYKPIRTYTLSVFYALLVSINISPESNRRKNITPPN